MRVLDLFSGIGSFSLGLERAGMRTIAFCEADPYRRAILAKHWPGVTIYDDVRTFPRIDADVICGGFPCQDISLAGTGAGINGERSGLWWEMHRIISEVRPRYAIIENVVALRRRGLDQMLRALAEIRYDAEWHCIPAAAIGAPHIRDRIWIIAYPQHPDTDRERSHRAPQHQYREAEPADQQERVTGPMGEILADADKPRLEIKLTWASGEQSSALRRSRWLSESGVRRVANGVANRAHRLRAIGDSLVSDIPEIIGRAIMQAEGLKP